MEVALQATGLSGMILTYSDDGLLLFYSPVRFDANDNYERIMRIQATYKQHGLVFHLGKTLVSSEVWEYLGDMCHRGHLLPMWVKEAASIGVLKSSRGIFPLRMRVSSFEGQVSACVSSGANPLACYFLLRFICAMYISNFMMCDDNRLIESLLIIPVSLGGMRIRSPLEMCMTSDVDTMAEFIADLELLHSIDGHLSRTIVNYLPTVVNGVRPSSSRLMMGNLVSSSLPDTSGMGVLMAAIEIIKDTVPNSITGILSGHPITAKIEKSLDDALAFVENIDHRSLSSLLMALPPWIKFTKSMALVRGSGAIRLIKRRELRKLQSDDTNKCHEAFTAWRRMISEGQTSNATPRDTVLSLISRCNRGFNLCRLKQAPRSLLRFSKASLPFEPAIMVR